MFCDKSGMTTTYTLCLPTNTRLYKMIKMPYIYYNLKENNQMIYCILDVNKDFLYNGMCIFNLPGRNKRIS